MLLLSPRASSMRKIYRLAVCRAPRLGLFCMHSVIISPMMYGIGRYSVIDV
jgi:hypothetical protein